MAMREKRGFWFDSKSLEVIPVGDHLHWLEELGGKFQFEFELTADERRWGKSLGLKPVVGWGLDLRGKNSKKTLLVEAMKRGWVRIRGHSDMPRMTLEFWKKTGPLMAALGVAVKQVASANETLELHEVSTDTPWLVSAANLVAEARGERAAGGELVPPGGEMLRELWAQTVEANKKGVGVRVYASAVAEGAHIRGNPFDHDEYDNPGPGFEADECGTFTADGPALCFGRRFLKMRMVVENPEEVEKFIRPEKGQGPSVGQFFVGLLRGLGKRKGRRRIIKPTEVIAFVKARRTQQLPEGLPGGASFVMQRGFFTDWDEQHLHPNEKSLQILIYPEFDGGENLRSFDRNMRQLGALLRRKFDQKSVILNLVVNGRQRFLGAYKWKEPEPRRKNK